MKRQHIYKQIALSLLLLVCAAGNNLAWGQTEYPITGDKYLKPYTYLDLSSSTDKITVDKSAEASHEIKNAFDNNDETYWKASDGNNATVTIDFGEEVTIQGMSIWRSGNPKERAQTIKISTSKTENGQYIEHYTKTSIPQGTNGNDRYTFTFPEIKTQYLKLEFTTYESVSAFNEIDFITPIEDPDKLTIRHKHAKWHDLRKGLNYDDDFDNENQMFDTDVTWRPESVRDRKIQATHTYIDTIYAHRGSTVQLTLPDYLKEDISIQSYQRWYSFRTGRTFATQYEDESEEKRIVDLLTPTVDNFYYRFANGYVGSPLSPLPDDQGSICSMNFYIPEDEEEFNEMFPNADKTIDNNWYVVACDVSGYTDYTETFDEKDSKNATFGADGKYCEPTLSHRIVFYIHAVEDTDNWYSKNWQNKEAYLEEYEINMPFTRLPDKADKNLIYEMVALSKDARSYVSPTGTKDENVNLQVTLGENTAGINLITKSLSSTDRVISFDYPVEDTKTGTKHVKEPTDGSIPMAEIIVKNGDKYIARFVLKFTKGTSLMTQSMIKAINDKREGTGEETADNDWNIYTERTPQYMEKNYEFLTGLDFNFKGPDARQKVYYPYPLAWDHCSYAFFDGSTGDYFEGGTFPQWGYYSIMNDYLECAESNDTWGWTGHQKAPDPNKDCMEPRNAEEEEDLYHMFIDASDRPGIIARLPFEKELCPGSELFVSAWVKSAKWNEQTTNAAMLFTFMGVKKTGENDSIFVPLYRHQTGQIPATYMSSINLPGFDTNSNEWFQLAFSFVTDQDIATEYRSFVLQIENNSASTSGGDMYLDDVRVYLVKPRAEIHQLDAACDNERTKLNFSLDWERLLSRTGETEITDDGAATLSGSDIGAIGLCFIDSLNYVAALGRNENPTTDEIANAIKQSVVKVGAGDIENDFEYAVMAYKLDFDKNTKYSDGLTFKNGALAKNNDWYFYYDDTNTTNKTLTVDFYSALQPYRPYIMLMIPLSAYIDEDTDVKTLRKYLNDNPEVFATEINDLCAIKTNVWVTAQNQIKVNGKILDPTADYCQGQVLNFSVQLRKPTGNIDENDEQIYEDVEAPVYFDWFFGTRTEFGLDEVDLEKLTLANALEVFRTKSKTATSVEEVEPDDEFTQEMSDLIAENCKPQEGSLLPKLVLHEQSLNITLQETLNLVVSPIHITLEGDEQDELICWKPLNFSLGIGHQAPELHVGFKDVTYPDNFEPSLRIGLEQIQKSNDSNPIKVNLRGAKPVTNGKTLVKQDNDAYVYLIDSNDPKVVLDDENENLESMYPVGKIVHLTATEDTGSDDYMIIYFDLTGDITKAELNSFEFEPREGYEYLLRIPFQEEGMNEDELESICYGTFNFTMKVVPEYQKWIGDANDNWNNDDNWARSTKDELKKADNDSYPDYTTGDEPTDRELHAGYVPMRFTNVVIPTEHNQVELYSYTTDGHKVDINTTTGSDVTDASTQYIEYDLMVKSATDGGTNYKYDCEPYYSNTVDQIHFEPKAEMLHAELLDYEKAWVDYKLKSNQWHTLASPLQGVVAGDFYTDSEAGSDANNVAGTENQEYFTDIYFEKSKYTPTQPNGYDIANSRISPSVYQRGWKGETNMVSTGKPNDVAVAGNWSAVYNDVAEPYNPGTGFSLKVLNMPKDVDDAIFRLPKADGSYYYYDSDGKATETSVVITRTNGENDSEFKAGQLQTNELKEANANITVTLTQNGTSDYYLIGNPFMAHLDAAKFFSKNSSVLQPKYWYLTDGVQNITVIDPNDSNSGTTTEGSNVATIAPLQSFFVQKKGDATETTVKFTAEMQTLAESTSNDGTNTSALILTAQTADGKTSRAAIAYDATAKATYETSEDAELFLDSNLSDVPTIYTVAGTMATSINRTSELYNIPVGIYGNSTETVTLSVEGLKNFNSAALYDAEKRTETPLREGTTITLPANTSGRYFLRAGAPTANEQIATDAIQIYTLSGNRVMVTSTTPLKDIRVYTISGALVKQAKAGFCSHELYLPEDGIYVISAKSANGATQTAKVAVN